MDTLSHAVWGRLVLDRQPRRLALAGALAGAAPDLAFFIPSKIEQILERGWTALTIGSEPGIWRADGPPLPPELVEAYGRYYVWSHSLVMLALAAAAGWLLLGRHRRWLWLAVPYGLHILMDIPTHERYLTRPLHPLSDWEFHGLAWSDPRVFWPHLALLALVIAWRWRARGRGTRREDPETGRAREPA